MKFRSKNLLVTGGAGFIGSNFINYLLKKYDSLKIYNLDLLTYAGNLENTNLFKDNPNYFFIKGDISNEGLVQSLFDEYEIDGVINFAAESHVDNSIVNPEVFIKTNINGVFNLLNHCYKFWMSKPHIVNKKFQFARFHQISTDEVYGSIDVGSFQENSGYFPNSPYSSSKASADLIVRSFSQTYGLNTTTSICSNNFGPNQNNEKFIPKIIDCLINNLDIPVYGDGKNIRDWIHVDDHCKAIDLIFNFSSKENGYNVGGNNEISNNELVKLIIDIFKKIRPSDSKIKYVKDRYGHDYRYSINSELIKKELGWSANEIFENKLKELIRSSIEN